MPTDTVVDGTAKAWVKFNGTGTPAINAAFNVSTITDNGVGDYTVNFTSAMADTNYSVVGTIGTPSVAQRETLQGHSTTPYATGSFRLWAFNNAGGAVDAIAICATFFR